MSRLRRVPVNRRSRRMDLRKELNWRAGKIKRQENDGEVDADGRRGRICARLKDMVVVSSQHPNPGPCREPASQVAQEVQNKHTCLDPILHRT